MVDFKIQIDRSPIQNNAPYRPRSGVNNRVESSNSLPPRSDWNGVDRRRRLTERRGSKKRPLLEMRQGADRRRGASVSITV